MIKDNEVIQKPSEAFDHQTENIIDQNCVDLWSGIPNICMTAVLNCDVSCIEISKNGEYVALGKDSEIQVWNYRIPEKEVE